MYIYGETRLALTRNKKDAGIMKAGGYFKNVVLPK
jgi:hypothetical protein